MKFVLILLPLPATVTLRADPAPSKTTEPSPDTSGWYFSLLPKSLQKDPRLDLTVITEMTPEGKVELGPLLIKSEAVELPPRGIRPPK